MLPMLLCCFALVFITASSSHSTMRTTERTHTSTTRATNPTDSHRPIKSAQRISLDGALEEGDAGRLISDAEPSHGDFDIISLFLNQSATAHDSPQPGQRALNPKVTPPPILRQKPTRNQVTVKTNGPSTVSQPEPPSTPGLSLSTCKKCYEVIQANSTRKAFTWWEAYRICKNKGWKLASIRSLKENNAVLDIIWKKGLYGPNTTAKHGDLKQTGNSKAAYWYNFWIGGSCAPDCGLKGRRHGPGGNASKWFWTDTGPADDPENFDKTDRIEKGYSRWMQQGGKHNKPPRQPDNNNPYGEVEDSHVMDRWYGKNMTEHNGTGTNDGKERPYMWNDLPHDLRTDPDIPGVGGFICEKPCVSPCTGGSREFQSISGANA